MRNNMSLQLTLGAMATGREGFLIGVVRTGIASEIGIVVQLSSPLDRASWVACKRRQEFEVKDL